MVQENFKKVEKANWLKIIFNSARFLISLLVLNIGVVLLFTVEISRNFYVSTVVIFIVLLIILGIVDFFVFSYYKKKYPNIYFYNDGFSVDLPEITNEYNLNIMHVGQFMGNFLVSLRAYTYILTLGKENMKMVGSYATLNANYIKECLKDDYELAIEGICMHEFS